MEKLPVPSLENISRLTQPWLLPIKASKSPSPSASANCTLFFQTAVAGTIPCVKPIGLPPLFIHVLAWFTAAVTISIFPSPLISPTAIPSKTLPPGNDKPVFVNIPLPLFSHIWIFPAAKTAASRSPSLSKSASLTSLGDGIARVCPEFVNIPAPLLKNT